MVITQQTWLGHKVYIDRVVGIGTSDVPHLVTLLGVLFPLIPGESAVQRFKRASIDPIKRVVTTVAI